MNNKIKAPRGLLMAAIIALGLVTATHGSLLVYEPFNYNVTNSLNGQNGGLGFSGGWLANAVTEGGAIFNQTATNVSSGAETGAAALTWDGKVDNLPALPTVGARYQGGKTNQSNVNIYRLLASSAGAMAAPNSGVLWMSAAYHWVNRSSLGSGINFGLGSGYFYDRGRFFNPSTASFIGVDGNSGQSVNTWNYRLNALVTSSGWQAGQFSFTLGTNSLPATNDLVVVLKFTFGASDVVEACAFGENETLSEAAFYASTNRVSATNSIDENQLTVLTLCQGRMANAQDEIRISTSFTDVVTLPPVGPVDIGISTVTVSPTNLFADGTSTSAVKVTLTDALGIPVTGKSVTLVSSPGNATISPAGAQTTDANGVVTCTATSTTAGTEVVTATDTTDSLVISQTASVQFTALNGDGSTSTVVASPTNVVANGVSASTITVTVKNAGGLPIAGKSVTLASSPGNATISPLGAQITGMNGQVTFTATSTTLGAEVFTATDTTDSLVIAQTASVLFSPTAASASSSTVVAAPLGVYANGSATSTITVTMKNSTGLPLPSKSIGLVGAPGIAILSPVGSQTTDSNGVAIYTAKSSIPGTVVFAATNFTDSIVATQTATVNFVAPNAPIDINFNFYNSSGPLEGPENPALLVGPNGGLGEVWNQTNATSATNLLSSQGLVTSVGFRSDSDGRWNYASPTLKMLHGGATKFTIPETNTLTITGLTPGVHYDVWLASANTLASQRSEGVWFTTNLTSSATNQFVSNLAAINGDTWEYGNNCLRFEQVVADGGGQITFKGASSTNNIQRVILNGFQLVQVVPLRLSIAPSPGSPGQVNFSWNSKTNKLYDLLSTNVLTAPVSQWPVWNNNENILGLQPTTSVTNQPAADASRFFAIRERAVPPPLLRQNFETNDGSFFVVGSPNDWAWGVPLSDSGSGFTLTNANAGSTNCWGTGLGNGSAPSGLITVGADSILQSPAIDFTAVTTAKLRFAAAAHAAGGDTIQVLVREVGTDALLATLTPITVPANSGWTNLGPLSLSAAVGKNAYLQFRFVGADGSYCGLYIDDVLVTSY